MVNKNILLLLIIMLLVPTLFLSGRIELFAYDVDAAYESEYDENFDWEEWDRNFIDPEANRRFRSVFYTLPAPFPRLIRWEGFYEWKDSRSLREIENENIAVAFVRYFNISQADFAMANEPRSQAWLRDRNNIYRFNSVFEPQPVDLIFTFDDALINEYFLLENSPVPSEFLSRGFPEGNRRPLHYNMPAPFLEIVGRVEFIDWRRNRSDEERENENIAVSFIRHFNVSQEDFARANDEMYYVWNSLRTVNHNSSRVEIYPVDLLFSGDTELINEFFLWENSPFEHERLRYASIQTVGIDTIALTITTPLETSDATQFTIDPITWTPDYTATITLRANHGYTFAGLTTATINNAPADIILNTGSRIILSYTATMPPLAVRINGTFLQLPPGEQPLIFVDDQPLLPLRAVMEALGYTVLWDGRINPITITQSNRTAILFMGTQQLLVNGRIVRLDSPPRMINNRTMVTMQTIAAATGADVWWNAARGRVDIYEPIPYNPSPFYAYSPGILEAAPFINNEAFIFLQDVFSNIPFYNHFNAVYDNVINLYRSYFHRLFTLDAQLYNANPFYRDGAQRMYLHEFMQSDPRNYRVALLDMTGTGTPDLIIVQWNITHVITFDRAQGIFYLWHQEWTRGTLMGTRQVRSIGVGSNPASNVYMILNENASPQISIITVMMGILPPYGDWYTLFFLSLPVHYYKEVPPSIPSSILSQTIVSNHGSFHHNTSWFRVTEEQFDLLTIPMSHQEVFLSDLLYAYAELFESK